MTFHSTDGGINFYGDSPEELMSIRKILATAYPLQFRSHAARLKEIPEPLSLLSTASRIRVIRAAQVHFIEFPVDNYATEVQSLFDALRPTAEGDRFAWTQYGAAKWALNYQDNTRAAAMLLRLGMIYHKSTGPACPLASQHILDPQVDGIRIVFGTPYSLQERMDSACVEILNQFNQDRRRMNLQSNYFYFQIGCVALYKQNGWFLSLTPTAAEIAKSRLKAYITSLFERRNSFNEEPENISTPEVEEPDEWVPEQEFFIPWSDFVFTTDASDLMKAHNRDNAIQISIESLTRRLIPNGFQPDTPYHRAELIKYISSEQVTRALRNGLFSSPKRGIYYLDFLKDIYDDKPETESEEE